jgi:hypothetical protein
LKCEHLDCGNHEKVWLPHMIREDICGLKSHPYCIKCGVVKNIGSDRAKGIGYFINVISSIENHLNIPGSTVRMRLAVKELEKVEDFNDAYSMSKFNQEKVFIDIVKKYYQIPERIIQHFL